MTYSIKDRADWNFEIEAGFMGYNRHGYKGAFPDKVEEVIKKLKKLTRYINQGKVFWFHKNQHFLQLMKSGKTRKKISEMKNLNLIGIDADKGILETLEQNLRRNTSLVLEREGEMLKIWSGDSSFEITYKSFQK